jgi:hypothetical protein
VINADEKSTEFGLRSHHDHQFLEKLKCDENTVYIFDKDIMITNEHFTEHKNRFCNLNKRESQNLK